MPVTVGTDGWTEVVPASHGYDHVYLSVDGADVYATNEEEPNQPLPYGRLLRDGDTFDLERSQQNLLSKGEPIYCQAVESTAEIRVVSDSQAVAQSRRTVERPGDTASRKDRRDTFTHTENVGATANALLSFTQAELDSNRYPVFLESATLSFQDRSVGEAMYTLIIYRNTDSGSVVRVQRTGSNFNDIDFDPAVRLDGGDDVAFEVYNPDGANQTLDAVLNYRYTAPGSD